MSSVAAMTEDLRTLVECESPSSSLAAVAASAEVVAALGARLTGAEPERLVVDGRTHLRWRFGPPGVLLLGHHDTVWPVGSLIEHPWRVVDGRAYGPGCFDMKAGLVQLFHALAGLSSLDGITVLVTGDEELGALTSRPLLHEEAARASAAFVLEASADGGALKTARKGVAWYEVKVTGRAAHAGLEPWNGVNAAVELAHQIHAIAALDRGPAGATVTPTLTTAGTTANTVPAAATVHVDARVPTAAEARRVDDGLAALRPVLDGARVEVVPGPRHPPFEPSSSASLFALARSVADRLGLGPLASAHVGGASDGNIVAGDGTPTLDGLGAVGARAHAPGEYVLVDELPRRAALLAGLVDEVRSSSWTNAAAADRAGRP